MKEIQLPGTNGEDGKAYGSRNKNLSVRLLAFSLRTESTAAAVEVD